MAGQRVNVNVDGTMVLVGLAIAGLAYVWWKKKQIVSAVNPADSNNIINRGVSDAVQTTTGCKDLGRYLWCLTNTDPVLCKGCAGQ